MVIIKVAEEPYKGSEATLVIILLLSLEKLEVFFLLLKYMI